MRTSAEGARKAGIISADEPFADFYVGRNPA
jgi:hypothetical protein